MSDLTHHIPLTFGEGIAAVRRAVLDPDGIPVRVVAGAVRRVDVDGPCRQMIDGWRLQSASGPAVGHLAALIEAARHGTVPPGVAGRVGDRYGPAGVVAGVAIASVLVAERLRPVAFATSEPLGLGQGHKLGTDLLGLAQQLQRSFGVIPDRWKAIARQPRVATRWWEAHDGALAPGALTGEEKWLAMASLTEVLGDVRLSRLYRGFLLRQGWQPPDVAAATFGRSMKLRRGFGPALRAVRELVLDRLDRPRVDLAGADLPAAAVTELLDLARLARALVVLGAVA